VLHFDLAKTGKPDPKAPATFPSFTPLSCAVNSCLFHDIRSFGRLVWIDNGACGDTYCALARLFFLSYFFMYSRW
jgi:hypothetical protein